MDVNQRRNRYAIVRKMKQTDFSNAESALVEYILAKGTAIEPLTIKEIAEANYVHPSTLIRVAKSLAIKAG